MDAKTNTEAKTLVDVAGATIFRLKIERYRAFQKFDWFPKAGLNVILGGGDAGKTTILEAIALLLNPSNAALVSDNDYWRRQRKDGFFIGAVISLPPDSSIATQSRPAFPWEWNGRQACKPQGHRHVNPGGSAVVLCRELCHAASVAPTTSAHAAKACARWARRRTAD